MSRKFPHHGTRLPSPLESHSPRILDFHILECGRNTTERWKHRRLHRACHKVNRWIERQDIKVSLIFIESFTYSKGSLTSASNLPRATLAKVLNPAPGNQSGTYLTRIKRKSSHMVFRGRVVRRTYRYCVNKKRAWDHSPVREIERFCRSS
jgi:hypothetical protein